MWVSRRALLVAGVGDLLIIAALVAYILFGGC